MPSNSVPPFQHMTVTLVKPDTPEDALTLSELPVTIGRAPTASLRISDRWLSRQHCTIYRFDDTLVVRDLGSTHGTYVNGQAIDQAVLRPGDRISVGLTTFVANFS